MESRPVCALPIRHSAADERVLRRLVASGWVLQWLFRREPLPRVQHFLRLIRRRQQGSHPSDAFTGTSDIPSSERVYAGILQQPVSAQSIATRKLRQHEPDRPALHGCEPVPRCALRSSAEHESILWIWPASATAAGIAQLRASQLWLLLPQLYASYVCWASGKWLNGRSDGSAITAASADDGRCGPAAAASRVAAVRRAHVRHHWSGGTPRHEAEGHRDLVGG